jgi:hypothetical protein
MGTDMLYTVQLRPDTSREEAQTALARVASDEVGLVFPLGTRCVLASPDDLEALHAFTESLRKRAIIVGGDETLRACAVTAGFAAATSVAEWETSKHNTVRPRHRLTWPGRRDTDGEVGEAAPLRRVLAAMHGGEDREDLYGPVGEDPPTYVADLMADEQDALMQRHAAVPTIPMRSRVTRRLAETLQAQAEARAMEQAHHAYEERVTATIRASAGPAFTPYSGEDGAGSVGEEGEADG